MLLSSCDCGGTIRLATRDRARAESAKERRSFAYSRRAEIQFARSLRDVARHVGRIVREMTPDETPTPATTSLLSALLGRYSDAIRPWAEASVARMQADVARRDESAWADLSRGMSRDLRAEISTAPVSVFLRGLRASATELIQSLPTEAAARVTRLAQEGLETGSRAATLAAEIRRTGEVTVGRANLIARTETARAASGLTQARALHVGSDGYFWRTMRDADVRNRPNKHGWSNPKGSHRLLEGKFIRWSEPPVASTSGERAHAGQIYNCRCYPEPVI